MQQSSGASGQLDGHHQAVVSLQISSPTTGAVQAFRALIDTGANASGISQRVVDGLRLSDDQAQSVTLSVRTVTGDVLIGTDVLRHITRQVLFDFERGEFKIVWND